MKKKGGGVALVRLLGYEYHRIPGYLRRETVDTRDGVI
jgi:hypothetical protein